MTSPTSNDEVVYKTIQEQNPHIDRTTKDFLAYYLNRYHAETISDKQFNNAWSDYNAR